LAAPAATLAAGAARWRSAFEVGKHPKQIYVTMMRRLCVYFYTVLKINKPFDVYLHKMVDS
jgi:hypothetical protein